MKHRVLLSPNAEKEPFFFIYLLCGDQGLFLAPSIVGESLKGAFLLAEVFGGTFGLPTNPPPPPIDRAFVTDGTAGEKARVGGRRKGGVGGRTDIVQAVELGSRDRLIRFCETVQLLSPVDAHVRPGERELPCQTSPSEEKPVYLPVHFRKSRGKL